ncbi:MAG: hypothetical protein RML93_07435, partial [Anaerolineales bacterium]|nr:hypothetical protein [Anaerolineales bacterium]MDW8447105.1 hypothetical protein [Anaerolineales bacterium]
MTAWIEDLYRVAYVVNLAFLFGLLLGHSQFKNHILFLLSVGYGSLIIAWQLGASQETEVLWSEKIRGLLFRLAQIAWRISDRQPLHDTLLFLLSMMILFWTLGLNTGYSLVRSQNVFRIVVPLFTSLFVIHSYDTLFPTRDGYLYWFSLFSALLIFRLAYLGQQKEWNERRVYIPAQLSSEAFHSTIGVV